MERTTSTWSGKRRAARASMLVAVLALLSPQPADADGPAPNAGGGAFSGRVAFDGPGAPPVNTPCRPASFRFTATAVVTLANAGGAQSTWLLDSTFGPLLTATGSSACENASVGGGVLTVDPIRATNPLLPASLSCSAVTGAYTRTGTDLTAVLSGDCAIDMHSAGRVSFYVRAEVTPASGTGNGTTTYITAADVKGGFIVVPA